MFLSGWSANRELRHETSVLVTNQTITQRKDISLNMQRAQDRTGPVLAWFEIRRPFGLDLEFAGQLYFADAINTISLIG